MSADVGLLLGAFLETAHAHGGTETSAGDLVFDSKVTAGHGLVLDGGGALVFKDGLVVTGDLVLTHATSVTFLGDVEVTGKVIIDAAAGVQFSEHFHAGGTVALAADEVDFLGGAGSVGLAKDFSIKTHTAGLATQVGFSANHAGFLSLTDADLEALQVGGKMVIGDFVSTGAVTIDSATFRNDVAIEGGDITVQHALLAGGAQVALAGQGTVRNDGVIDVSGAQAGSLILTGHQVGNFGTILAMGTGATAGGHVTMTSTLQTLVSSAGVIDVSGGTAGGTIHLWSDTSTTMAGQLSARGGQAGGDGGFVEVSSAGGFSLTGLVNTTAAHGKTGMLLLDPKNVIIANAGGGTVLGVDQFSDTPDQNVTIAASTLTAAATGVTIQANNDITVNAALTMSQDLTLLAGRSVLINQNITLAGKTLTIIANDDAGTDAYRDAGLGSITTLAGVTLGAGSGTINLTVEKGDAGQAGGITIDKVVTTGTLNLSTAGFVRETAGDAAPTSGAMTSDDDLTAGTLNLTVTAANASFGEAVDQGNGALEIAAGTVNASVQLGALPASDFIGYFVLTDADHTNGSAGGNNPAVKDAPMTIGNFNAGGGSVILTAKGASIVGTAGATPNITAMQVNLTTERFLGPDLDGNNQPIAHYGAIGTAGAALRTNVSLLTATASDGGIFIDEADSVLLNKVIAQDKGVTAQTGANGAVVIAPQGQSAVNGASDAVIRSGGDMVLLDLKVADQLTLQAGGAILDGNQDSANILARGLTLTAGGAIGDAADAIETSVMTVQATTTDGGISLAETDGVTVSTIAAGGASRDVLLTNATGSLLLGAITAGGNVTVKAQFDSITDNNGAAANITAATATLEARTGLGTSSDLLEVSVGGLTTKVSNVGAATNVASAGTLTALSIETNNGAVGLTLNGGSLAFVQPGATNQLSLTAPGLSTFSFSNTGGSVALNTVQAGTGAVSITAKTFIADYANDTVLNLTGGAVTLKAGTYIGAQGNAIETNLDSLTATADAGGIFIADTGSINSLTATAKGAGNDIQVNTAGDLGVAKVIAPRAVTLGAGGSVTRLGNVLNVSGASATLQAGGALGTSTTPLLLDVRTLTSAVANGGGAYLQAKGVVTATAVKAIGGDVELVSEGNLTLGLVEADTAHTVKLTSTYGTMIGAPGNAINIRGGTANLSATRLGASDNALDTEVGTLKGLATSGGIFINELNSLVVTTLEAQGLGSDLSLTTGGSLVLGVAKAEGDKVNLKVVGGGISDGNGSALNITADQLDISATAGVGALQNSVNKLGAAFGGSLGVTISNVGVLSITDATLEGRGASKLTIEADTITILDMADDLALLDANGSVQLTARTGNVVFLDPKDTISVSGAGSIGISAGLGITPAYPNTGAVAVIGNLTTTGGNIDVRANHHITIGLLDTGGNGNVTVASETGVIIDGNGAAKNVIGNVVTLSGALPGQRVTQLETSFRIADYSAVRSEAAAKLTTAQSLSAATAILNVQQMNALTAKDDADSAEQEAEDASDSADKAALASYIVATALDGVATALGIARDIVAIPAGAAQAIPLTGDGGAMTGYSALDVAANVADVAAYAAGIVADQLGDIAEEKANDLVQKSAELTALSATYQDSLATWHAFDEATSIAQKAADAAAIAREHALMVRDQAISAEDQSNVVGTAANPLGVEAHQLNATANDGSVYLAVSGDLSLGGISATGAAGVVSVDATGDIYITGATKAPTQVSLQAGKSIIDGGGTIETPKFLGLAAGSIGTTANPIHTATGTISLKANTGTVGVTNMGALEIGSIVGTDGITAAGDVSVASTGALTFSNAISATGQTVILLSQSGSIIDAHTGIDVTALTLSATSATGMELDTNITNLTAKTTAAGAIKVHEANAITLTSVQAANGAIAIDAAGSIIASSVVSQIDSNANDITLQALGSIQAGLISAGGSLGDVSLDATGSVTSLSGGRITSDELVVKAGSGINLTTTARSADLSLTGAGGITVVESDALLVNHLTTFSGAINLTTGAQLSLAEGAVNAANGASNVTISAGGPITGPLAGNGSADILGAIVSLATTSTGGTLGSALLNPLEINATARLDAQTANSHAYLEDEAGGIVLGLVNTGLGDLHLKAVAGSITAAASGNGVADIVAAHVDLKVTGAASQIGSGESTQLKINGSTLTVLTEGGSAYLADTAGGVALNTLNVGSGNLFLTATGGAITDNESGAINNITANKLMLSATAGVGTAANAIEANVAAFEGSGGTGGLNVTDLGNGMVIGGVSNALGGVTATGGNIIITTQGALGVQEAVTNTGGDITLTALDSAATGDHLTVQADLSATGNIKLLAGDDVTLNGGTTVTATGTVDIRGDAGDLDAGVGSHLTLDGAIRANRLQVTSGNDEDSLMVRDAIVNSVSISTGGGADEIIITAGNTLGTGSVDAGAGNDRVTISTTVENVLGNDGDDLLLIKAGGRVTGSVDGGAGFDTVVYDHDGLGVDDYAGPVTINLQTQSGTDIAAFSGLERIEATSHADDHLIGANAPAAWHITGANAGDIGGTATFQFTGFENLTGGTKDDSFQFGAAGRLAGNLEGGGHTGHDTLDYNGANFSAVTTVTLDGPTGGTATAISGRFDGIDQIIGDVDFTGTNSLTAGGADNTWVFTGLHTGNISNQLYFQNFGKTGGGGGDDTFAFANGAIPAQPLNGGAGNNVLDLSAWTSDLVWKIQGDGSGTVMTSAGSFQFTGMTKLIGGSGRDRFIFSDDKILGQGPLSPGAIIGGGGTDFIDLSAYTTANVWTRTNQDGIIETNRGTWTYTSVEEYLGSKTTTFKHDVLDFTGSVVVTMPGQLLPGEGGGVTTKISNIGNDDVLKRRIDTSFYLSLDGRIDANDVLIGQDAARLITLRPGQTSAAFYTATKVPVGTAPGQYHLLSMVDSGNAFVEGDESNNVSDNGLIEVLPVLVDLQATSVKSTLPAQALPGAKGTLTATVTNTGNSPAKGKVDVEFFLSQDGHIDLDDMALGGILNADLNLAGGASRTFSFNTQVPEGTPAGDYQVLVRIDGRHQIAESNEINNAGASTSMTRVSDPFVDLSPDFTRATLPSIGIPNDILNFQVPIKNSGNIAANGKVNVDFYLSLDGTVSPGSDLLIKSLHDVSISIGPNGQQFITTSAAIPTTAQNGTYFVLADIDSGNSIVESNNANNTAVLSDGLEVVWRFGTFADRKNVQLTVPDAQGHMVTFSVIGQGVGNVLGGSDFSEISVTGTNIVSRVKIDPAAGATTQVGDIITSDALFALYAPKVNLQGDLTVNGSAFGIQLGNISGQHQINIGAAANPNQTVGLSFGHVENVSLTSATPVRLLTVRDWLDTDATPDVIQAPWFKSITSTGDFQADILATGTNAGVSLSTLMVQGVASSAITLAGGVTGIKVGGWSGGSLDASFAQNFLVNGDVQNSRITLTGASVTAGQPALSMLSVTGRVSDSLVNVFQNAGTVQVGTWGAGSVLAVGVNSGGDGTFFDGNEAVLGGTLGQFTSASYDSANSGTAFGIVTDKLQGFIQLNRTTKYTSAALPVVNNDLQLTVL